MKSISSLVYQDVSAFHNRFAVVELNTDLGDTFNITPNGTDQNGDPVKARYVQVDNYANIAPVTIKIDGFESTIGPYTRQTIEISNPVANVYVKAYEGIVKICFAESRFGVADGTNQLASNGSGQMGTYLNRDGSNDMLADLDMGGFLVTNMKSPVQDSDGATKGFTSNIARQSASIGVPNTAANNTQALKDLIAATPAGGVALVYDTGAVLPLDASGALGGCANINKTMTLVQNARFVSNAHGDLNYCLQATAPNVVITGTGSFKGDGYTNDANADDLRKHPGLIYAAADGFFFDEHLTIDTPPKVGIALVNCNGATIRGKFVGGPSAYTIGNTAYFGICAGGGGGHKFEHFTASRDGAGGRFVNFIFTSDSYYGDSVGCTTRFGTADVWEKIAYLWGADQTIHDVSGFGVQTDFVRAMRGTRFKAHDVKAIGSKGLITLYDATDFDIHSCEGRGLKQIGIYLDKYPGSTYAGDFGYGRITNCKLIGDGTSTELQAGIRYNTDNLNAFGVEITGNHIENLSLNAGTALIELTSASPRSIQAAKIENNQLYYTTRGGILLNRCLSHTVKGNQLYNVATPFAEIASDNGVWDGNHCWNATTPNVQGKGASSLDTNNTYK